MRRITRSSAQQKSTTSDKPLAPTPTDLEIARHHGTTAALDATPDRLQASKKAPAASLSQRIEELTRENGRLRLEISYYQQKLGNAGDLRDDVQFVTQELEQISVKFSRVEKQIDDDWYQVTEDIPYA